MKLSLKNRRTVITLLITSIILTSIPISLILIKQKQEIRKKAAGTPNKIICIVQGDRYNSNSIRVINNTNSQSTHNIHKRYCRLDPPAPTPRPQLPLQSPYVCNEWDSPEAIDQIQTISASSEQTFTINIPNCMIGQLDITGCECFNLECTQTWQGGMAYTMQANTTGYDPTTGTCPNPTETPNPTPTTPNPTPTKPNPTPTKPNPTPTKPNPTPTTRPTNTPAPTAPPGSTPTPTTSPPVSGNPTSTIITIIGGTLLILTALLL